MWAWALLQREEVYWLARESGSTENAESAKDTAADDGDAGDDDADDDAEGGVVRGEAGVAVDADVAAVGAGAAEVALDVDVDHRAWSLGVDGIPKGTARRWDRYTQQGSTESCWGKSKST